MHYVSPSLISNFTVFKPSPGTIVICVAGSLKTVKWFFRISFILSDPVVLNVDVGSHFRFENGVYKLFAMLKEWGLLNTMANIINQCIEMSENQTGKLHGLSLF